MHLLPRVGVELELLAPRGRSRRDLAVALAGPGGTVTPTLLHDTEPSVVPGTPVFDTLTLGFVVRDAAGAEVARVVDDLTLQDDLDKAAPPQPGGGRVGTDDRRLLHLARRHGRADAGPEGVLAPLAALFGVPLERLPGGLIRVRDPDGMPVALGAPLPGERERPAELVTPPLGPMPRRELHAALERLLAPARALGFTVPAEAATHLHLDAAPLRAPAAFADAVEALHAARADLRAAWGTNPRCRRLGPWPDALLEAVRAPGFRDRTWAEVRPTLRALGLSKYVDVNLKGVVHDVPGKPTVELRALPGADHAEAVLAGLDVALGVLRPLGLYR